MGSGGRSGQTAEPTTLRANLAQEMLARFHLLEYTDFYTGEKRGELDEFVVDTLMDFIDPFSADTGPDELLKRLVDGAPPLTLHEPGAHMDGLERVRRRRKKKGMLRGHDTFHHSGEHRRAGA